MVTNEQPTKFKVWGRKKNFNNQSLRKKLIFGFSNALSQFWFIIKLLNYICFQMHTTQYFLWKDLNTTINNHNDDDINQNDWVEWNERTVERMNETIGSAQRTNQKPSDIESETPNKSTIFHSPNVYRKWSTVIEKRIIMYYWCGCGCCCCCCRISDGFAVWMCKWVSSQLACVSAAWSVDRWNDGWTNRKP